MCLGVCVWLHCWFCFSFGLVLLLSWVVVVAIVVVVVVDAYWLQPVIVQPMRGARSPAVAKIAAVATTIDWGVPPHTHLVAMVAASVAVAAAAATTVARAAAVAATTIEWG